MRWLTISAILALSTLRTMSMEVKVFKYGVGDRAINMVDETQFKFPDPRDFTDDILKQVDFKDEYDELVPSLPRYDVHKFGEEVEVGSVPIVTRPKPYWSTPSPRKFNERAFSTPPSVLAALEAVRATRPTHAPAKTTTVAPKTTPETLNINQIDDTPETTTRRKSVKITTTTPKPTTTEAEVTEKSTTERPSTAKPKFQTPEITRKSFTTTSKPSTTTTAKASTTTAKPSTVSGNTPPVWRNPNFINRNNEITVGKSLGTSLSGPSGSRIVLDSHGKPVELKFGAPKATSSPKPSPTATTPTPPALPIFNRPTPHMWQRSWSSSWKIGPNGQKVDEKTTVTETRGGKTETKTISGGIENLPRILPPPIIHTNPKEYRGPTFNCRVLDAAVDGVASPDNDETCKLNFPGYPADETCRCTFKVQERDEAGCALGFIYTCRRVVFA
ncbi:unnamed protein product [Bursaphelenchus xylophilus]|uniref:(pine wood nematode) hypothetical protein n=1 Tax=Bursaphelenchus xylophilus TaxID=6326 RepID=A0A1I7RTY1_BURXY|nr:unnamed protein product [Bursaphelenchus xylophilus]CAG9132107.1 unnamed protein product [Bursaphelenchus xylophilus]